MKSTLLTYIDRFRQNRRERLVLGSVLLFLAVIVSLIVYWQLRYTGITMSNETFCGYEEHVHTEECYDEEGNLICELEEHSHTVDCLINLNADVEDATVWKATLPELTGDLRTDVVNIAYSQLGYTESTANFSPGEDGVTRYGYTRYGAWYGNEYGTWDAMFVSFCLNYAGVDRTAFPLNSGAYSWAVELSEIGSYAEASAYTPLAGDIVFFDSDYDGRIDRVGIVASTDISGGVVTIIEGDYTVSEVDTVCEHIYALNDPTISGYGIIAVSEEAEEEAETEETAEEIEETEESEEIEIEETEEETEESPTLFYTASDSGVNVTVIAPEGALPDGAILSVSLLDEESDEYAEAAEAVGYESADTDENAINAISEDDTEESEEVATALAVLDISFIVDGETVEPTEAVTVIIDASSLMTEDADTSTLEVQHLEETPEGITPVLVADATDETEGTVDTETAVAEFTVESFSSFTLRWNYQGSNYKNVTVNVYDTDGNQIDGYTDTKTYSAGTTVDLTTFLDVSGYTFSYATITSGNTTYSNVTEITYTRGNSNNNSYFTVVYNNGNNSARLNNNSNITINLYYAKSSASLTVYKYETGTNTQLSGATLELTYTGSGSIGSTTVTVSGGTVLSQSDSAITFTTTGSAITLSNLPDGTYTLTETAAPDGYETASGYFTFTVLSNSITNTTSTNSTYYVYDSGTVNVYNDPKTVAVYVNKVYVEADGSTVVDASETSGLTATFTLNDNQSVSVTGANTSATAFKLRYGTTYTLSETAPSGYAAVSSVTITVDSNGNITADGYDSSTNTITITNKKTVSVTVEKVYVDANGDVTTSGIDSMYAVLTVTGSSGSTVGAGSDYAAFEFTVDGLTDGTYTVTESTVPGGYTSSDVSFTISNGVIYDESGDEVDSITVTNAPDSTHSLAGMSYAIANLNSQYQYCMSSDTSSYGSGLGGVAVEQVVSTDSDGIATIYADGATIWTFEAADDDNAYYIYTTVNGTKYYLRITNGSTAASGVYISTERQAIYVTEGTGSYAGQYRFSTTSATTRNTAINWYGNQPTNYGVTYGAYNDGLNTANEMLTLCTVIEKDGLYITDDLISSGRYIATLVINGVEVDLTDSRYTVTWYKSDYTLSADLSTCTNNENYSEVTNSDALGENNSTVNVAIDQGGLCYYYVEVYDSETGETYSTLTYQVEHVPYAAELMNCSFEYKQSSTNVPFWGTTSYDGQIEIGAYSSSASNYGTQYIYAGGSQAAAGDYFAELNANYAGSLYQDVITIGGESLNWAFYHRARTADGGSWQGTNITDEMYVVIMSTEDAEKLLSGINQTNQQSVLTAMITSILGSASEGSGDYTLVSGDYAGDTVSATIWTVSSTNSYQTGEWNYNSGTYTVPDEQYVTRFFFVSKSSGYSSTNYTVGNLIDYATFSQNVSYVIEYWTRTENSGDYKLVKTTTGSEYPYTNVYADISTYTAAGYGLVGSVTGTASGGSYPADYNSSGTYSSAYTSMFDQYTTTGMRISSGTMYLSVYLSMPVVTVIKQVSGLSESQLDAVLDEGDYDVTFTITDNSTGETTTLTVHVGSTGIGSSYTTELAVDHTYTISEVVVHDGTYLDDYDMSVTVSGANTTNALGTYTFTVEQEKSITITFTNTYAEVVTGGPEMPQTGGRGTKLYTTVGLLLICSGGYLLYRKLKQQKRKCNRRWNI